MVEEAGGQPTAWLQTDWSFTIILLDNGISPQGEAEGARPESRASYFAEHLAVFPKLCWGAAGGQAGGDASGAPGAEEGAEAWPLAKEAAPPSHCCAPSSFSYDSFS